MPRSLKEYKLILLGGGAVGKSALALQFSQSGHATDQYDPTLLEGHRKLCSIDGEAALLDIWETSGTEEYRSFREQYISIGKGFLLVYSITSRDSFGEVGTFHQEVLRIKGQDFSPVVIVGNKSDIESKRQVSVQEGSDLAKRLGCQYFETSAREYINVDDAFNALVREIREYDKPKDRDRVPTSTSERGKIARILKEWVGRYAGVHKKHQQDGCCHSHQDGT